MQHYCWHSEEAVPESKKKQFIDPGQRVWQFHQHGKVDESRKSQESGMKLNDKEFPYSMLSRVKTIKCLWKKQYENVDTLDSTTSSKILIPVNKKTKYHKPEATKQVK